MFFASVNQQTMLRVIEPQHGPELFRLLEANRDHIRRWHPWVDILRSENNVSHAIAAWQQQDANEQGFYAGIWHDGRLCGMINHAHIDQVNRWASLGYWLDAAHQGRGIMTESCRAMIDHGFTIWKLNRITIECATENTRSRAIPERLGFKLEGIIRQIEWLGDHYADHALYGLLNHDSQRESGSAYECHAPAGCELVSQV
ncbi:MAG TPA: GNAT family protein [Candidatus Acidoferrales bacterium]|jgi:ribosomal-protein-serine acetyltransferase|nr:GNAT family protein [Candidatus Acidoferrales bacterium]